MKKLLFALVMATGLTTSANAFIYAEGMVGLALGSGELTNQDLKSYTAPNLTARLGMSILPGIYGALHFDMMMESNLELKNTSTKSDIKGNNLGIVAGVTLLPIIKAYGGYLFSSKREKSDGTYKGNGFLLGVGFSPLPIPVVDLNFVLEYRSMTFDEWEPSSGSTGSISNTSMSEILLGVAVSF